MPRIDVYPDKLSTSPVERHQLKAGDTLEDWLIHNVPSYTPMPVPPISAMLNGVLFIPAKWGCTFLCEDDLVVLVVEPEDPGTWAIVSMVIAIASAAYSIYLLNNMPDAPTNPGASGSIYDPNAQGNKPKLMRPVPEVLGSHPTFPDYICQPRRAYVSDEIWIYLNLCIGRGTYTLNDLLIGNTPVSSYESDIDYQMVSPGSDVSGHVGHLNVYTSPEVGQTSGTAGIEIVGPVDTIEQQESDLCSFSGATLTLSRLDYLSSSYKEIAFEIPAGLHIIITNSTTEVAIFGGIATMDIVDGGGANSDIIQSRTGVGMDVFSVDDEVVLTGAGVNDGTYYIETVSASQVTVKDSGGTPVSGLTPMTAITGQLTGYRNNDGAYRIESISGGITPTLTAVDPGTLEDLAGWTAFNAIDAYGVTISVVETDLIGEWVGPFFACPSGETSDNIWLSFAMNSGLVILSSSGSKNSRTVQFEVQYRGEGETTWSTTTYSRTAATIDQIGDTISIALPSAVRPEVRVRRLTSEIDSSRYYDKTEWVSLQAKLETPTSYPEVTTLQIAVRGTNSLASAAENKIRADVIRHLPSYTSDAWQSAAETESIADAALYVLTDSGHTDAQINLDEMQRLRAVWQTRGDTFSGIFDSSSTVFDAIKSILSVGYAEPTIDWGQVTPVRDEPRTALEHVYTPDVMTSDVTRDIVLWDPNEPDGVEVEWFNKTNGKPETVLCLLSGDAGIRPEKVKAFGITDETRAWRFGMRRRRALRYRTGKLSWSTELAALNSSYGSYCAVTDGIPGQPQSGRVAAQSGTRLILDRQPEWSTGVHYIALRGPDGALLGPYTATAVSGQPYQVDLSADPGTLYPEDNETYQIPTQWLFGPADSWCISALVRDIKPQGEEGCQVSAIIYDSRVYDDDDNAP